MIRWLLVAGADINATNIRSRTALSEAGWEDWVDVVQYFLDMGADVNVTDESRETPLFAACFHKNEEVGEMSLNCGANVNTRNRERNTPLDMACMEGEINDMVRPLLQYGARPSPGDLAAQIVIEMEF
jgi:ankyrin repeat protein